MAEQTTNCPYLRIAGSEAFLPQSTVLVVDDSPQNVELLIAFLEELPVKVVTAVDGVDALGEGRATQAGPPAAGRDDAADERVPSLPEAQVRRAARATSRCSW